MDDIVLKDRDGTDITYPGINSIRLKTADGGTREFLHGETAEKTVAPDFSGGDMEIPADGGTFLTKVTVEKPEDLLPENIREGKEIGGVAGSAFVVDMAETVILEEKTYDDFGELGGTGIYAPLFAYEFNFVVGETYHVIWDDEEYVCVAYEIDGLTGVGSAAIAGMGEDTGEPFLMGDGGFVPIATLETDASHVIGVSQKTREDVETATVELSLADGDQEVTPSASDKVMTKVTIKKPETLTPEHIAKGVEVAGVVGTLGVETEEATVNLDFSNGAMEVLPTGEKTFSKVNIPVPDTLIPDNIAEGVNIAGIIGALAAGGGGGNIQIAYGSQGLSNLSETSRTIKHNLRTIPDLFIMWPNEAVTSSSGFTSMTAVIVFLSPAFAGKTGLHQDNFVYGSSTSRVYTQVQDTVQSVTVTTTTVKLNRTPRTGLYAWIAIAGLT